MVWFNCITAFRTILDDAAFYANGRVFALRTLEAAIITVGIVSLLAVVTLRQQLVAGAGTDALSRA